jgi:hypothetical protein
MDGRLMSTTLLGLIGALVLGVAANDLWALSSGIAQRVVVLAARLWSRNKEQAEVLTEEWQAYIGDRPGQILKLLTALALLTAAIGRALGRKLKPARIHVDVSIRLPSWTPSIHVSAGEHTLIPAWLLVGLFFALSPIAFYFADLDISWSYFAWTIGGAVAISTALSGSMLGFLTTRPPKLDLDYQSLEQIACALSVKPQEPPATSTSSGSATLVRPYLSHVWKCADTDPPSAVLIRPYVTSNQANIGTRHTRNTNTASNSTAT